MREGGNLTLRCAVAGDPPPSLSWEKIFFNGTRQELESNTPRLDITDVRPEDEATYACVASSLAGKVEDRLQLSVDPRGRYLNGK